MLSVLCLAGCQEVVTIRSTIKTNGVISRVANYAGGGSAKSPYKPSFLIPRPEAGVTVHRELASVEVRRQIDGNRLSHEDLTFLGDDKEPLVGSCPNLVRMPNGDWKFVEVLHWKKTSFSVLSKMKVADFHEGVAASLPARHVTPLAVDAIAIDLKDRLESYLLGPSSALEFPSDGLILDKAQRIQFHALMSKSLRAHLATLTEQEIRDTANRFLDRRPKTEPKKKVTSDLDTIGKTKMVFELLYDGEVVETNGFRDPTTGGIHWVLNPFCCTRRDVVLYALIRPRTKK